MKFLVLIFVVLISLATAAPSGKRRGRVTTESLVESHGYPFEEHSVQTSDGYVLTMHRIPYSGRIDSSSEEEPRPVAFLMHGILCSSSDWVLLGPDSALAYLLSDAGYDVWLGNARGNTYSREHVTLNPFFGSFWNFDWHEIGLYDLPAMIDYIRFYTGEDQVTYFGHSQGTTTFLLLNSLNQRFKTRIRSAHLLAPVAYMENMESPMMDLTSLTLGGISKIPELFGNLEFMPSSAVMRILGQASCADSSPIQAICSNVLFLIAGHDAENLNTSDEEVLELDHLKHDEPPATADESVEGGDIHFEISSVAAAQHPVAAAPAAGGEDTPINPTDLLPELEQQLEEMTTAKTSTINNAAAGGQKEGAEISGGVSHHRPPMLQHHDGGKVGSNQQQQAPMHTAGGTNEESIGTVEGNVNSPILTKPFYGAARLAFGQNPEVPSTSTSTSTTTSTTTIVPTTIITSPTTNENIPESIITSPPSAQSIETSGVLPPADSNNDQVNNPMPSKNSEENNNNSNLSSSSSTSTSVSVNSNEKEQVGDTFVPQLEATKPGPERRSMNVMPLKTAENLLKHKDGQYSSFDMAQYVFWTGDEAGVARAVEEFIEQGLMTRENAIKFLRDIRLGIEYLQSSYANRVFPDQLRDNFIKKHSHNSNPMPTPVPVTTTSTTTSTTTTTRRPLSTTTERTRSLVAREYLAAPGSDGRHHKVLNEHLDKTIESMPSHMRLQDVNSIHHERERTEHDEAAGRAKIAKFLYTEFSLEEVIYQLGKVMFSESLAHGSDQAQQELQRLTDFLEEEGRQGMISPELQKKVLDVLLQALSDTLVEHPELLATARANLGNSFEKIPTNSLESKN